MSWALFIIGGFVLGGLIKANPAFGMTADEVGLVLGCALWLLAFVAWAVERFTPEDRS